LIVLSSLSIACAPSDARFEDRKDLWPSKHS
jgi:hypothetical protein